MTDKELIERLAMEVAGTISAPFISDEALCRFSASLIARYLEERGKEAIYQIRTRSTGSRFFGDWIDCTKEDAEKYADDRYCEMRTLFLAPPPITEGMAMAPTKQIISAKLYGDQSVTLTFTSCRAAEEFLLKVKP